MIVTKRIAGLKEIAHLYTDYFFDLDGVLVIFQSCSGKAKRQSQALFKSWNIYVNIIKIFTLLLIQALMEEQI